jgi:hypothetical protein
MLITKALLSRGVRDISARQSAKEIPTERASRKTALINLIYCFYIESSAYGKKKVPRIKFFLKFIKFFLEIHR